MNHHDPEPSDGKPGHGGRSHWLMIACCIPMLMIAVALVATGVAGPGFIIAALTCTAMMALMMRGMSHGISGRSDDLSASRERDER